MTFVGAEADDSEFITATWRELDRPCTERAPTLARRCSLDATAIWEWGVAERVSTALLCTRVGRRQAGREMLATADHVA